MSALLIPQAYLDTPNCSHISPHLPKPYPSPVPTHRPYQSPIQSLFHRIPNSLTLQYYLAHISQAPHQSRAENTDHTTIHIFCATVLKFKLLLKNTGWLAYDNVNASKYFYLFD
jgi:hypothetical protein